MTPYLNELAPWERRREYYHYIQLGKDVRTQTGAINKQTKAMVAAQLASANAIIASQDRIAEGIDSVSYGIERIEDGIYGLQAAFEWGISEVVWQIEQNREVLRDILEVLSAPLDTQAKELRRRAEDAYSNGWIDDALEDFLESERKNRYDFSIHISLGMIYLFHIIDKGKALEYFEKAIKYARPKSAYHVSYALLYKALIMQDFANIEEAEKCTAEAVELAPDFAEALYRNAQYNSLLNRPEKALKMLERAISYDVNYCEKSHNEADFDTIRNDLTNLFERLRGREGKQARRGLRKVSGKHKRLNELLNSAQSEIKIRLDDTTLRKRLDRIKVLMQRHSYRDYLEANDYLYDASGSIRTMIGDTNEEIRRRIRCSEDKISQIESSHESKYSNYIERLREIWGSVVGLGFWLGIILGVRGCWMKASAEKSATGIRVLTNPIWALISITFKVTVMVALASGAIVGLSYIILKASARNYPAEISQIQTHLQRMNEIADDIGKI